MSHVTTTVDDEPTLTPSHRIRRRLPVWLAVLAVIVLAVNLRPGATSVGPLLSKLRAGLNMGPGVAALLSAMPPFCFAIFGAFAARIGGRFGTTRVLAASALVITGGLLGRVVAHNEISFLLLSVLALAGMAVGNVMAPVFVKRFFPGHVAGMMSVYTTVLPIGALAPSLMVPIIFASQPGDWRLNMGWWGATAAVALIVWVVVAGIAPHAGHMHDQTEGAMQRKGPTMWEIARTRKGLALGLFFGLQSMQAYVSFGWLPQIFRDAGLSVSQASLLLSLFNVVAIPGGLVMPIVAQKLSRPTGMIVVLGMLLAGGYLGLLLAPAALPWLWTLMLSLSGWAFPLAIALVAERSRDPLVTAQLSGFSQALGYLIAGVGTWLVGTVHGMTSGWSVPLIALIISAVLFVTFGIIASARGDVDDELPAFAR